MIEVDLEGEEENETSNSKEKEVVIQIVNHNNKAILQYNDLSSTASHRCVLKNDRGFSEVATPPPELFIA